MLQIQVISHHNTMSEKSNKKQCTDSNGKSRKTQIDAVTKTLANLLRKPLLSLLDGA